MFLFHTNGLYIFYISNFRQSLYYFLSILELGVSIGIVHKEGNKEKLSHNYAILVSFWVNCFSR